MPERTIVIKGAREHNLKGFDLVIPRGRLTVITGVSGSGKSSLAFDTLFREGQRRFLETLPGFARQFAGGLARPAITALEGIGPAVAVGQRSVTTNPRSTVGTLTEVWDFLRLLFARLGTAPEGIRPTRGLFSFNEETGACPRCQGLGVEDQLDLDLLVADPARSLRDGALRVSTPNGYLMYSQVTLPVLDDVLRVHGGSVDIPWKDLAEEVRQVVLYGSDRLKVAYGKHPLESRLKWTGITARPRPEGFYRGLVPVMEEILRGKRNDSILRFVRSSPCGACEGRRLRPEALAVKWRGRTISELAALTARDLSVFLGNLDIENREEAVLKPIRKEIQGRCELMEELGLGYLTFDRPAPSLSRGEAQRLRLLSLAMGELRGLVAVLDEPSAGLHPHDAQKLLNVLRRLRDQGQTVVVVEHDATLAAGADWLVDLGPGPGTEGGELLWSGPPSDLLAHGPDTPTRRWLQGRLPVPEHKRPRGSGAVALGPFSRHNLQGVHIDLQKHALNVISGVSGAGKTSLLEDAVAALGGTFRRIVTVDAAPIGRTPRSNAATYSGAFDFIRDLFAGTADAKAKGLGKGHFTFNTAGGRCEACEGAGVIEVGMKHLGSVELICEVCGGRRFHADVLSVLYRGRSIADVLEGSIMEAAALFADQPKLRHILQALLDCGLGYLPLGQPATTLSGGEAQRVKLATELARAANGTSLIALDEPSTGLHAFDVRVLLEAWDRLIGAGHTLLVADNDPAVLRAADHIVDLGPGSGPDGGRVIAQGTLEAVMACPESLTGRYLTHETSAEPCPSLTVDVGSMELLGVTTHNLQNLDVTIPARGWTAVIGPSGSGKSSLVFDTLLAESRSRFNDLVAPWARRLLPRQGGAELISAKGLQAAVAVSQKPGRRHPRSRVGTLTELDGWLQLLFARIGERPCPACGAMGWTERCACGGQRTPLRASEFSPNSEAGACQACKGLGFVQACDPARLITAPERSLVSGAMDGTRFGRYLGEPDGRYVATLRAVGSERGIDFERPWKELPESERALAMRGAGSQVFEVAWRYRRGRATGVHHLSTLWEGFAGLVDREYERIHLKAEVDEELEALLGDCRCPACEGERLKPASRAVHVEGKRLPELMALPLEGLKAWFEAGFRRSETVRVITEDLRHEVLQRLEALIQAGLGYLSLERETSTLSGGEAQRVRLASALSGGLTGVTYVLDEPSRGLHPRDTDRLAKVLRHLAEQDNAVVVVEHDARLVAPADHVIELGPGSGSEGGRILATGSPEALRNHPASRMSEMLAPLIRTRQPRPFLPGISIRGAHIHNLNELDVVFPVGLLTVVTGVSGSGKSSLVLDVLAASLRSESPVGCREIEVHRPFEGAVVLEQNESAGNLSTVATLTDVSESLRKRFAATPEAKARKLSAKHFSTAAPGGRCEICEGRGILTVAMDLLPDVTVGCEACGGQRFLPQVLECRVDGMNIREWLDASVTQAAPLLPKEKSLQALEEIGLGYLRLGQETRALSGGEFQRLRLASLLAEAGHRVRAILLDEPTKGLGYEDVEKLARTLHRLAQAGHLLVVIEHDLAFIADADWIIDLGPEGGPGGGCIVAQGTPRELAGREESMTGRALRRILEKH